MYDADPFNSDLWTKNNVWAKINGTPNDPKDPGLLKKSMGPMRVAQHIFPTIVQGTDKPFPADTIDHKGTPTKGNTKSFATIKKTFKLYPLHIQDEPNFTIAMNQVMLAAQALALAEDLLFFQGQDATLPHGVSVEDHDKAILGKGLLGIAEENKQTISVFPNGHNDTYGSATYSAVFRGISMFNGQGGPYALILEPAIFADANFPLQDSSFATPASAIQSLVEAGGFVMSAGLPPKTGLLVSLGGQTTSLYIGTEPVIHWDNFDNNIHSFTATQSIQFHNVDPRSLIKLEFKDRAQG
jgi:hypothetical protein